MLSRSALESSRLPAVAAAEAATAAAAAAAVDACTAVGAPVRGFDVFAVGIRVFDL